MFFKFIRAIVRILLAIINGNAHYQNKEKLPEGNYILVAPHRTWWDPVYIALAAAPKQFSFLAKAELFKNPILRFILVHLNAFPVDRDKPGPSVVKRPVKLLKETDKSLIMFPSGTRHSSELKGGMTLISRLSKKPIVPSVYQGPTKFSHLFKRTPVIVRFGDPIDISDIKKMDKDGLAEVEKRVQQAFDQLDHEINPDYNYRSKEKNAD
ncbi:1-acyl-sn-glycerol-3-phosphate acyltransferase [Enterococcus dongliensis]|uniref:1-acyl-sn-glycerol-3-phosphate acyltransferase n=1 Tax=Enterococcus dongliensis TaxID=2559925 RepID=A0AAP5NL15_9ENTE|nr:1-acyl-sn-glycerol-3-phosphate acyltransferase [Enterococcus dongliensis]MDT2596266.1 1-acyl-sn-glycerol-3-phosphate acyltransferase [Enterococcus dongliensis]MDT2604604.1 1-acyl-sn-glycerol-3-phosphate acyltransferase [Enterococcus dongliensis]MDT2634815.1 1-acyl-sn-glycerol-3-phosphate acyltransferase [Enterococcus dongliensis]MDT2637888.1 1-acyl-sn-glycerol-3-phosphate acyltransferase [Enterococcus dongliensis]MDT2639252.1 1-acyl-sn-glycerol-3-phosphate acyltransferase [Enterococcus dong